MNTSPSAPKLPGQSDVPASTGIRELDAAIGGGLTARTTLLLAGEAPDALVNRLRAWLPVCLLPDGDAVIDKDLILQIIYRQRSGMVIFGDVGLLEDSGDRSISHRVDVAALIRRESTNELVKLSIRKNRRGRTGVVSFRLGT